MCSFAYPPYQCSKSNKQSIQVFLVLLDLQELNQRSGKTDFTILIRFLTCRQEYSKAMVKGKKVCHSVIRNWSYLTANVLMANRAGLPT